VRVSICPVETGGACSQSDTRDECGTCPSSSRSLMLLDRSFSKLVEGLRRIPRRHRDDGKSAAAAEVRRTTEGRRLRRPRRPPEQTHSGASSQRTDHDRPGGLDDGGSIRVENGDVRSLVKDCVVVLERSPSVDKMAQVTASCPVSETKISGQTVPDRSHRTTSLPAATRSSLSPLASSSLSSSSLLVSAADRRDQPHRRLSLRKSPRSDTGSCSPQKSTSSDPVSAGREETNLQSDLVPSGALSSVHHKSENVSDTLVCSKAAGADDRRLDVSREISAATGRRRLKRRKVCLQLTTSPPDGGPGCFGREEVTDRCIVGQNATGLNRRTAGEAVLGGMEVMSPRPDPDLLSPEYGRSVCSTEKEVVFNTEVVSQPDPDLASVTQLKYCCGSEGEVILLPDQDFSPLHSAVKRAKTATIAPSETAVGQPEVVLQPDPDSRPPDETNDNAKEDITFIGRTKVMLQSYSNFPKSLSSMKCLKTPVVNLGQSEVIPQPDPYLPSLTPVICITGVSDETLVGRSEVVLQSDRGHLRPDPDSSQQPADSTDFSHDCSTDAMYHLALFSSPETSDLDSSPPVPSSPTESFPGENQIRRPTFSQSVDDADDAVKYPSDLEAAAWTVASPQMTKSGRLKADIVHRTSDHSALSSPSVREMISAVRKPRDKGEDFAGESGLVAEENVMVSASDSEESSSQNLELDLVRCVDVQRKKVDPTPATDELLRMLNDDDECSNKSKNVILDVAGNANVRNKDISSTPSLEEPSLRMAECAMEDSSSLSRPRHVVSDFVGHNDARKNHVAVTPDESRSLDELSANMVEDLVVLRPGILPPSRHQVVFDLATSSGSSLLQSARDAFYSDAGDLPSHPRYVVMLGMFMTNSDYKTSSGDEIANVNFYAVRPEATRIR